LYQTPKPKPGEFWVDVIDVGQGLSVLVRTTDKSLLYDTGAKFSERFDIGRRVVVPYLKTMGLQQLNQLIISHGDNDHAGGANSILEMIAVQNLLVEPQMVGRKKRFNGLAKACKKGLKWQWIKNQIIEVVSLKCGIKAIVYYYLGILKRGQKTSCFNIMRTRCNRIYYWCRTMAVTHLHPVPGLRRWHHSLQLCQRVIKIDLSTRQKRC